MIAIVGQYALNQNPKLVRIPTDSFVMETIATLPLDIDLRLDLVDNHIYFTGREEVDGEFTRFLFRVPSSGGTPERILALSSSDTMYRFIDEHVYLLDRDGPVIRVTLTGGTPEEVIPLTNVEDLQLDESYYYIDRDFPDFDQVRVPINAPDQFETLRLGLRISARFIRWSQDPDHVYAYDTDYWKIDSSSFRGELIAETPIIALNFKKGREHLFFVESYSQGTGENRIGVTHTVALKWDDGSLETIDTVTSSSVTETNSHYYVIRYGALLRYER